MTRCTGTTTDKCSRPGSGTGCCDDPRRFVGKLDFCLANPSKTEETALQGPATGTTSAGAMFNELERQRHKPIETDGGSAGTAKEQFGQRRHRIAKSAFRVGRLLTK
jgi:hypothetical protein